MEQSFNFNIYNVKETSRVEFIRKTYSHVALAVLAFVILETILLNTPFGMELGVSIAQHPYIILILVLAGSWFANKWAHEPGNTQKQYLGLFLFTVVEAIIFLPIFLILLHSPQFAGEVDAILGQSVTLTAGLFTGLSAVALFSKKDFSFLRSVLAIAFPVALAMILAGWIFGFNLGLWFSVGMILLAGASILYQTSRLVHDYHTTQHVAAALALFSSLMMLFFYILRIFMNRD